MIRFMRDLNHSRSPMRLAGCDYSTPGYYFLTVRRRSRVPAFASGQQTSVYLTPAGNCVLEAWDSLNQRFAECKLDEFRILHDHVHGIVQLVEPDGPNDDGNHTALHDIVRAFKSTSAVAITKLVGRTGTPVWQRGYYERVIRNEQELAAVRQYVRFNHQKLRRAGKQLM